MAVPKLLLIVVGVVAQEYGVMPPNVRPPTEQLREQRGLETIIPRLFILTRALVWSWVLLEASVLIALSPYTPPAVARSLLQLLLLSPVGASASDSTTASLASLTTPTPAFLAGIAFALGAALLRAHCYHTLGRHFTFELAIRPQHTLVTSGAYGVVRHPSYTGLLGLAVGWFLCALDPRGVVVHVCEGVWVALVSGSGCGWDRASTMTVLACAWVTGLTILIVGMRQRMDKEDAMLERNFGEVWRGWAKRVPYRLIPGIY